MSKKIIVFCSFLFLFLVIISGCGKETPAENTPKENETTIPADSKEIVIKASNFSFDIQEIHIKKGEKVKLTLKNTEGKHGLSIKKLDIDLKGDSSVEFTADKKGTFEFICSMSCGDGHDSMKGKLIIE